MIEPLRYHIEKYPPQAIPYPIFCQRCLSNKRTKDNPKLVIKYCPECPRCNYLCKECDEYAHSFVKTKDHMRRIVVIGPAVRKKIHTRGDSRTFPKMLDSAEIKFKAKVIHNGKVIHKSEIHHLEYPVGVSGQCVHVQILGGKKLPIADAHGSSDPFVCVTIGGKRVGTTRTRPRTINPRWNNETYIIPVEEEDDSNTSRVAKKKLQDLIKLEVFDRDYFNFNDFLGHIELTKQQLLKLAYLSKQKPIRLSIGTREYHGRLGLQFGINANLCYLKVVKAESLDKTDAIGLSDPYCEVYFKNKLIGKTNVCHNTLDPIWTSGNVFTFEVEEVLKEEIRLRALARLGQTHRMTTKSNEIFQNAVLFRIEIFDYNRIRSHEPLGTIRLSCDSFRRIAPSFPKSLNEISQGKSINHLLFNVKKARNSVANINPSILIKLAAPVSSPKNSNNNNGNNGNNGGGFESNNNNNNNNGNNNSNNNNDNNNLSRNGTLTISNEETNKDYKTSSPSLSSATILTLSASNLKTNSNNLSNSSLQIENAIAQLDHIEENDEDESNVDPSIADEDSEIYRPEPKDPKFEYELNENDENENRENENQGEQPIREEIENQIPEWRRWDGSLSESEISSSYVGNSHEGEHNGEVDNDGSMSSGIKSQIPFLNLERRRSRLSDYERSESMNTSRSKITARDKESENEESNNEENQGDDSDSQTTKSSSIYGRTGRGVTPRVNHNLPSYDDDDDDDDDQSHEKSNQEDEDENENDPEQRPLLDPPAKHGVNFLEEDPDEEKPSITDRLKDFYETLKTKTKEQYKLLFPEEIEENPTHRRQSLIEILSRQRKSIVGATVGLTQWFPMKWFDIHKQVEVDADADNKDRGQLIVRLIPSMRGYVVRGLDIGVKHMTLGETSTIKVRYDYGYGNFWMGPEIPPRSNINFTVQLISINGSGGILQMPWRQFLRFYRLMRRNSRRTKNACIEFGHASMECYRAVKKAYDDYYNKKEKVEEEESFVEEIEEEEEPIIEEKESEESDDEFNVNDSNRGILAGAGAMWGYDPKKRPKKPKKSKEQRAKERLERERLRQLALANGGEYTSRSTVSRQSRVSKQSRTTNTSSRSKKSSRRTSRQSNTPQNKLEPAISESTDQEEEVVFEHDDSASEASNHSSSIGQYSSSTASKRKKGASSAIDESGHRRSTQYAKKSTNNPTNLKRRR